MYNRSSGNDQKELQKLLKEHFESALKDLGIESVEVHTQHSPTMAEGFDILLTPPVERSIIVELQEGLSKKFKLSVREWGYYVNDAEKKCDGIGIVATASSLLRRAVT